MSEVDFEDDITSSIRIDLFQTEGNEASFRLQNAPGGEYNRPHIQQHEAMGLALYVDLLAVYHEEYIPGGQDDPASLVLFGFRFAGSEPHRRRFRKATIDVRFAQGGMNDDVKVVSDQDPVVNSVAPSGSYILNTSSKTSEVKYSLNIDVNSALLATFLGLGLGGHYERATSTVREKRATVFGTGRIVPPRNYGAYNGARWVLKENELDACGIASELKTAVLLKRKALGDFQAIVKVDVDVDVLFGTRMRLRQFFGDGIVDPIYFSPEEESGGPKLDGLDIKNLSELNLEDFGKIETKML